MATFDRERREIVLRVVYDGAATAGKTENLRALHALFGQRARRTVYAPAETVTGRTLYFDSLELATGHLDDWSLRCQILTVPGQFVYAERRYRLLRAVDAVVLVCESTPGGVKAARSAWAFLAKTLSSTASAGVPVLIQANKQDLPGALAPAEVAERVAGPGRPVFPASAVQREGVRETFLAAFAAARAAVREQVAGAGPEALGPPMESTERLHEEMLREAEAASDPGVASALDEALALVAGDDSP